MLSLVPLMTYQFKTKPFKHQREVFEASKDLETFAIFWEQGTGKSKLTVDVCAYNYEKGRIDAMVIIAPNNVHTNDLATSATFQANSLAAHSANVPRP